MSIYGNNDSRKKPRWGGRGEGGRERAGGVVCAVCVSVDRFPHHASPSFLLDSFWEAMGASETVVVELLEEKRAELLELTQAARHQRLEVEDNAVLTSF